MQQQLPFNFKEVFKLTNLGLSPDLFKFGQVTFESQKYVCVRDTAVSIIPELRDHYIDFSTCDI